MGSGTVKKGGRHMRHKKITALLLSVIVAVSSCMPAFAAEENAGQILETGQEMEDIDPDAAAENTKIEVEEPEVTAEEPETESSTDEEELEKATETVTADDAAAGTTEIEVAAEEEPDDAAADDAVAGATEIEVAAETEVAEADIEADDAAAAAAVEQAAETENAAADATTAAKTEEPEKQGEPVELVVVDGSVEGTSRSAEGALATWDAEKLASLPILETDVSSASDGCVMLGLPGEYIAAQRAVLDRINAIRKEACEQGVPNPESATREPLSMDDYVPLKWSYDLEKVARIRAAETAMTADHVRTNTNTWQSVNSIDTYVGECAAWNYSKSATSGIEQWYDEKSTWVNGESGTTGHYTMMIRPAMRYLGGGTFYSPYTQYPNATLIEFYDKYRDEEFDESFVNMTGECIQMLEVAEENLNGDPSLLGTFSGVKDDEQQLFLTTKTKYTGIFAANTKGLLYMEGVNWSSSDSKVANVSSDGIVKAVKCGSATITAVDPIGSSAEEEFTVNHVLEKIPAEDATCTATGLTEGEKCVNCGTITAAQETVAALGHSYGSWTVTKPATCTVAGSKERTCSRCGNKETQTIAATGHTWEETYTVDKEATCTATGSQSKHCSVCGAINSSSVQSIPMTDHTYGAWKVTQPATCEETGSQERVCSGCGKKETQVLSALGHKWDTAYTVDKEATCKDEGIESHHCTVCGAIDPSSIREIPKTDHTYGAWKVTQPATCEEAGSKERVCSGCGIKETQTIPATGHSYGEWTVTKEATGTEAGIKERVCKNCGSKQTAEIPVLEYGWQNDGKGWKYLKSDTTYPKSKFEVIDGKTYYFNASCYRVTGLQTIDGKKYYFNTSGQMQTGWQTINGVKYYFEKAGAMHIGWLKQGDNYYYFKTNGAMLTGWLKRGGKMYYFKTNGQRLTGWLKRGGKYFYFKTNGEMLTGWLKKSGKMYYFKTNGQRHTGWLKKAGKYYYFNPSNGQMVTGRCKIGSKWFTFDKNGVRQ